MKKEELIKLIETYSNAIIAFIVLQAVAYSFTFGTNAQFNCMVRTAEYLAIGLVVLFLIVMFLSIYALIRLKRIIVQQSGEFSDTVSKLYVGKLIVAIVFSLLPLVLTVGYGVVDYDTKNNCVASKLTRIN